jgi:hypothetical protein
MRTDFTQYRSAANLEKPHGAHHNKAKRARIRGREGIVCAAAICLMIFASGCAATHEPYRWSKGVTEMNTNVYGSWIWITPRAPTSADEPEPFGGELIAVSRDSIYIASPTLRVISIRSIRKARLNAFDPYPEGVGGLTFLGSLTTISNGWFLGITWPMWILGGTITATARSYAAVVDYPGETFEQMGPYARFPAGLPPTLDRSKLNMVKDQRRPFGF